MLAIIRKVRKQHLWAPFGTIRDHLKLFGTIFRTRMGMKKQKIMHLCCFFGLLGSTWAPFPGRRLHGGHRAELGDASGSRLGCDLVPKTIQRRFVIDLGSLFFIGFGQYFTLQLRAVYIKTSSGQQGCAMRLCVLFHCLSQHVIYLSPSTM